MDSLCFQVTEELAEELAGERIDKCIGTLNSSLSRSYLQKLIKEGHVLVNGNEVKANYRLRVEDAVTVSVPPSVLPDIEPENIPLDILYEDEDLLVVNKPKGMVVHPAPGHYSGTLVNGLMYHCKNQLSGINGILRPGIVHRIDKDTTGSLLVCKNDFTHQHMALQLKEHTMERKYHAIVHGTLRESTGTVHAPIGRHPKDRKKMAVVKENGKDAVTHYTVLKQFHRFAYIECCLETGRTHQIRVHMESIGHPVLGDELYGHFSCPYSLTGQTLHAQTLAFVHPRTGEKIHTKAPLPQYFQELLVKIGKEC